MGTEKRVIISPVNSEDLLRIKEPVALTTPVLSDDGTGPVWIEGDDLGGGPGGTPQPGEGTLSAGASTAYVLPGLTFAGLSTGALGNTDRFYFPILVREEIEVVALVGEVVSGNGASRAMRVGLYEADFTNQPGALVGEGEFDASTTGVKTVALGIVIPVGRYLVCQQVNNTTPVWRIWTTWPLHVTTGANGFIRTHSVTTAYSALPDPGTAWDTTSAGTTPLNQRVVLQVAEAGS